MPYQEVHHSSIVAIIFKKLYTQFWLFNKIISDRGPQFAAKFQKELALSSAYHPSNWWQDGKAQPGNRNLPRIFCSNSPSDWANHIPMAEFVHNIRPHSSMGKSPFHLIMGYGPKVLPDIINKTDLPAVEKRLNDLEKARNEAAATHELARYTMWNRFRSNFVPYETGDKVWLEAWNLKRNMADPKFAPKREGPFKIKKILSPLSYQLELPQSWKIHPVFHKPLTKKKRSPGPITQNHHLTLSTTRKNTKLNGY